MSRYSRRCVAGPAGTHRGGLGSRCDSAGSTPHAGIEGGDTSCTDRSSLMMRTSLFAGAVIVFAQWTVDGLVVFVGVVLIVRGIFTMFSIPVDRSRRSLGD